MKLVSFRHEGAARYGMVSGDGVHDLSARLPHAGIRAFIAAGGKAEQPEGPPDHALADLELLPVVPDPGKIVCIGLNYQAHKEEGVRDPSDKPMLFARWADTLIGHEAPLVIPKVSDKLDFEAEMVAVIGRDTGRGVKAAEALDYVYGYACMNEGSVRDWQRHSSQVTAGKNFVGTGAVGPWLVTADELGDPQSLDIFLTVNGTEMQRANTAQMIWPVAEMIEYITTWMPLGPGDMIATGTPAGVGSRRDPPVFLQPGDVVEVTVTGLGTLRNTVVKEG